MKKTIILFYLLLIGIGSFAQDLDPQATKGVREWVNPSSEPPNFTSGTLGDVAIYTKSKSVYEYVSNSGAPISRWRKITHQATIDWFLRKGQKGDTGATGMNGLDGVDGKDGKDGICPNCPPVGNGGSGTFGLYNVVNTNGVDDSQTWQTAVDSAYVNHKPIYVASNTKWSRGFVAPKDIQNLVILGNGMKGKAINNSPFTFMAKPLPASVAEAEQVYTFSFIKIENFIFEGNGQAQIGINMYAGGGHTYEKILGYSMKSVINLMFSMNARVESCEAINSVYGFLCISGMGFEEFPGIPGATFANSSPNKATFWNCRTVGAPNQTSKYGFVVIDASGVSLNDPTIEGHYYSVSGIYWNSTANTADGAIIVNPHLEVANPCPKGFIYLRSGTSMHNIDGGGTGKAGIVVYVETPGVGYPQIKWSNIGSNKMKLNQGKVFKHAPGATWFFEYVDDPFTDANVLAAMDGSVTAGCNGANKFCISKVKRNGGTSTQGRMAKAERKAQRIEKRETRKAARQAE